MEGSRKQYERKMKRGKGGGRKAGWMEKIKAKETEAKGRKREEIK